MITITEQMDVSQVRISSSLWSIFEAPKSSIGKHFFAIKVGHKLGSRRHAGLLRGGILITKPRILWQMLWRQVLSYILYRQSVCPTGQRGAKTCLSKMSATKVKRSQAVIADFVPAILFMKIWNLNKAWRGRWPNHLCSTCWLTVECHKASQ